MSTATNPALPAVYLEHPDTICESWTSIGRLLVLYFDGVRKAIKAGHGSPLNVTDVADFLDEKAYGHDTDTAGLKRWAAATLRNACATRGKTKGNFLRDPSRCRMDASRYFLRAYRWHAGLTGGSLWGPIGDRMLGGGLAGVADTLAVILRVAAGLPTPSTDRWQKAIHG